MRAMILAAGRGTRLRPLTDGMPKPLLPLVCYPVLGHILDQLRQQGIRHIAINLHYQASQLSQWLGDGRRWGLHVRVAYEPELLGTAGGIKQCAAFLHKAPFFVINADVLMDLDLYAVWQWHCQRKALVTMVVRPDHNARQYGPVVVDTAARVIQINGRPTMKTPGGGQETIFTGVQVVSPQVLDRIPPRLYTSTTVDIYPALVADQQAVYGYRHAGYWLDIGVPHRYLQAHWDLMDGIRGYRWLNWLAPGSKVVLDHRSTAHHRTAALLIPPVVMGPGVTLDPGARVGPYAVLGAGCRVGAGAEIRRCVVWEGAQIAARARLHQSIIARGMCVRAVKALSHGMQTV